MAEQSPADTLAPDTEQEPDEDAGWDEFLAPTAVAMDTDADQVVDTVAIDTDADQVLDTVVLDTDADHVADTIVMDADSDQVADTVAWVQPSAAVGPPDAGTQDLPNLAPLQGQEDVSTEDVDQALEDYEAQEAVDRGMTDTYEALDKEYGDADSDAFSTEP